MDGTILGQGRFIVPATVVNQVIAIPSNADFMWVRNYTNAAKVGGATGLGVEYYWQRGMAAGTGMVEYYGNGTAVKSGDTLVSGGFTLYDPSGQSAGSLPLIGNPVATTVQTNATQPVVTTASTAGIAVGTVVRMSNSAQTDVNGVDMVVGAVTLNTNFTLLTATNPLANVPGVAGGAGFYRIINVDPLFYPSRRFVVNITKAVTPTVSTSVAHGYCPGQEVRFSIPALSPNVTNTSPGMIQLNSTPLNNYLVATIVSVTDAYNFVINVDTSAFNTFVWPTAVPNQMPSSFPSVSPVGEDTANALVNTGAQIPGVTSAGVGSQIFNTNTGILSDSTVNTGVLGMLLGTGGVGTVAGALAISGPAGTAAADVVYWVAGKSTYGGL